jgi:hypothetical protein
LVLVSTVNNNEDANTDCFPPELHALVGDFVRNPSNEALSTKTLVRTVLKRRKIKKES